MTVDIDDLIRDALEAKAEDLAAEPQTDAAWLRLETATRRQRLRRPPLLALVGAVAAAAVLVAVLARPDDQEVRVVPPANDDPGPSTTAIDGATDDGAPPMPEAGGVFPGTDFVAVRPDGALVRVTVSTGAEEVLASYAPNTSSRFDSVQSLSLDPEGLTAYFELGSSFGDWTSRIMSVPTDGSAEPTEVIEGRAPSVDASGTRLAFIDEQNRINVLDLDTEEVVAAEGSWGYDLAWLMDGRLATTQLTGTEFSPTAIATFQVTEDAIVPDEVLTPPDGVSYRFPQMSAIGTLYAVNDCCGDVGPTSGELVVVGTEQRFTLPKLVDGLSGGLGRSFIVSYVDGTLSHLLLEPDNTFSESPLPSKGYELATW